VHDDDDTYTSVGQMPVRVEVGMDEASKTPEPIKNLAGVVVDPTSEFGLHMDVVRSEPLKRRFGSAGNDKAAEGRTDGNTDATELTDG
jgi:hypothetical protein